MTPGRSYNRSLHIVALLTAAATFPLIFMGGLVTSHVAGMSVPDWPNSYGYNMFLFPPRLWKGGILYEHLHRLMGAGVGMLSILLAVWAWRTERRRWVRWLALGVLGAVIFQGVLGGLRVVLIELDLAIVHACFAQAFFCLAALAAVVTSRWWTEETLPCGTGVSPVSGGSGVEEHQELDNEETPARAGRPCHRDVILVRLAVLAVIAIYLQLIVGAVMRHYNAGLAIPDLPLNYGQILPPVSQAGLQQVNEDRIYDLGLPAVTMTQVWLHFGHRVGAIVVTLLLLWLVGRTLARHRGTVGWGMVVGAFIACLLFLTGLGASHATGSTSSVVGGVAFLIPALASGGLTWWLTRRMDHARALLAPAVVLAALLVVQLTLGVLTVLLRKPADVASAHVAVGALILVTTFVLLVRSLRLYSRRAATISERFSSDGSPLAHARGALTPVAS